jgi:hypothetical protein
VFIKYINGIKVAHKMSIYISKLSFLEQRKPGKKLADLPPWFSNRHHVRLISFQKEEIAVSLF